MCHAFVRKILEHVPKETALEKSMMLVDHVSKHTYSLNMMFIVFYWLKRIRVCHFCSNKSCSCLYANAYNTLSEISLCILLIFTKNIYILPEIKNHFYRTTSSKLCFLKIYRLASFCSLWFFVVCFSCCLFGRDVNFRPSKS